jgi:hypothetical protein
VEKGFRCEIAWSDAEVVEVEVCASNGAFAGRTRLYVSIGELAGAATLLEGFPAQPDDRRMLILGAFGPEYAGGAVSLAFALADDAKHARVQVVIEADGEVGGITETVTLALPFEAASLQRFVSELRRLEEEKSGGAFLPAAP